MIKINIEKLLRQQRKSKYQLRIQTNLTSRNLNRIIRNQTTSISFKYIEDFYKFLNCTPGKLILIQPTEEAKKTKKDKIGS